ncbi:MAG: DUF1273 domain-containing protein [Ruminococcus sp.]|nr:DUF1273 domain-containing protein [Ruminococcus sp.]
MLKSLYSGIPVYPADMYDSDLSVTACITGHREKSVPSYKENPIYKDITLSAVKLMLYRYIDMAVERGYTDFFSRLAVGTDLWAAEYIIKKRRRNGKLRLIGVMPYLRHSEFFPQSYREILCRVEGEADRLLVVNRNPNVTYRPSSQLYRDRNYFMVDNSSAVIAFLNRDSIASGTGQTVNYANRRGRRVCRFGIEDVFGIIDETGADIRKIGREIQFLDNAFDLFC